MAEKGRTDQVQLTCARAHPSPGYGAFGPLLLSCRPGESRSANSRKTSMGSCQCLPQTLQATYQTLTYFPTAALEASGFIGRFRYGFRRLLNSTPDGYLIKVSMTARKILHSRSRGLFRRYSNFANVVRKRQTQRTNGFPHRCQNSVSVRGLFAHGPFPTAFLNRLDASWRYGTRKLSGRPRSRNGVLRNSPFSLGVQESP